MIFTNCLMNFQNLFLSMWIVEATYCVDQTKLVVWTCLQFLKLWYILKVYEKHLNTYRVVIIR